MGVSVAKEVGVSVGRGGVVGSGMEVGVWVGSTTDWVGVAV
jgi:hypothetical protein